MKTLLLLALVWNGLEVWDKRVVPLPDGSERVEMSVYNRGDDTSGRERRKDEIRELFEKVSAAVGYRVDAFNAPHKKQRNGGFQYELKGVSWGITDGVLDYVRITTGGAVKRAAKDDIVKRVKRRPSGDVLIDSVPMVDQGQKGYCAVAVAERVLRYYGNAVDEHQLAQMAGSTAGGGTSVDEMKASVKEIGSRCRLGFNEIVSMSGTMKDIRKEIESYNKAAKALKKPPLDFDRFIVGNTFMVAQMREAMDPDVLLRMRVKDSRYKKFMTCVKTCVDRGVPVFWGVTLGIFPESGLPQQFGGHMRLIIGYNAAANEILYSDSWGPGHELKRMRADRAFAITHDAFTLRAL